MCNDPDVLRLKKGQWVHDTLKQIYPNREGGSSRLNLRKTCRMVGDITFHVRNTGHSKSCSTPGRKHLSKDMLRTIPALSIDHHHLPISLHSASDMCRSCTWLRVSYHVPAAVPKVKIAWS
jgi:hypothetical protein